MMSRVLLTIGHSTLSLEELVSQLIDHGVAVVCDVRSSPYSRHNPQFNREPLQDGLKAAGIGYVYLGNLLGARSDNPAHCKNGKVRFDRVARSEGFREGLRRLRKGVGGHRICLLCAEKDPIACHRTILVCRHMRSRDLAIRHILEDGSLENHRDAERRLMRELKIPEDDLFASREELIENAYARQGERIAYAEKKNDGGPPLSALG